MQNVLVTGALGFIGSNFVNYILKKHTHVNVIALDCNYPCASKKNLDIHDRIKLVIGKIQERDLVAHILREYGVDTVIHFAAQSHVDTSFSESLTYTYDNIYGTHCLLEECRLYGKLNRFIHISTDEVYGESSVDDAESERKHETSVLCPTNPYAATKAGAELLARAYHLSYKMPVIITRGNNVYGPRQYPEKLIPKFINQIKRGEKCTVHGDGSMLRAFIHVDDVVRAVECIVENGKIGEIYNIGSCDEYSVLDVTNTLVRALCGSDAVSSNYITFVEDRIFNDKRYHISDAKLKALGWEKQISWEDGIANTIAWYNSIDEDHWIS